jgi:diguanylate cyclase (GGDEF)-like protein
MKAAVIRATARRAAVVSLLCAAIATAGAAHSASASASASLPAKAASGQAAEADALMARDAIDAAARDAAADPAATARLAALAGEPGTASHALAAWALANVHLQLGDAAAAAALVWRLDRGDAGLDRSVAALVRAQQARDDRAPDLAAREAREALQRLDQALAPTTPSALDDTLRAETLRLLGAVTGAAGQLDDGLRQLQTARRIAQALRDPAREALALDETAELLTMAGHTERAEAARAEAWQVAQTARVADTALRARLQAGAARRSLATGRTAPALAEATAYAQAAVQAARASGVGVLQAEALCLLSQAERLAGDPPAAQRSARAAISAAAGLPATAALQRLARAQLGLAQLAAGQIGPGRQAVEAVLADAAAPQRDPLAGMLLRQLDEALRAAGEPRAALAVFHRERALQQERLERERGVMLADLRAQYDRERQQRELATLDQGNAAKAATLAQRALMQRALWVAAVLVALALLVLALLYRRLRALRVRLAATQERLRQHSERDPLTGLANRRHCQALMAMRGLDRHFDGALLLLDIDHFKRINDTQGHAVGDTVLIEVAQRLAQTARSDDLVVRWGGEEFLVISPWLPQAHVEPLAERLRWAVAGTPIATPDGPLTVTVSIGHARFPRDGEPAIAWERALDLVDAALYAAKANGRNQVCAAAPFRPASSVAAAVAVGQAESLATV